MCNCDIYTCASPFFYIMIVMIKTIIHYFADPSFFFESNTGADPDLVRDQ